MADIVKSMMDILGLMQEIDIDSKHMTEKELRQNIKRCRKALRLAKKLQKMTYAYPMMAQFIKPTKKLLDTTDKKLKLIEVEAWRDPKSKMQ